jgi:hypothetical protein
VGELENSAITLANGIFTPHSVAHGFSSISYLETKQNSKHNINDWLKYPTPVRFLDPKLLRTDTGTGIPLYKKEVPIASP